MIDIHNHILPAVDDGPDTIDESIEISRIAAAQGIKTLFATSHVASQSDLQKSLEFPEMVNDLQAVLRERNVDVEIIQGAEVYPSHDVPQYLKDGYPLTLGKNSRYILIDSPLSQMMAGLDDMIFDLQTNGYIPILAHPERVTPIQKDIRILEDMVRRGLLLQVNAASIISSRKHVKNTAIDLLKLDWVHFIASDAHSIGHRRPMLGAIKKALIDIVGEDMAYNLLKNNAEKILNNEMAYSEPKPYVSLKRSWFAALFGHIYS